MVVSLAVLIFVLGYLVISLAYFLRVDKSAVALLIGGVLWVLIAATLPHDAIGSALAEAGSDIFSIIVFLLGAMTLVEILTHYRIFDLIRVRLFALHVSDRAQFWIIGILTFCLSPILDNLTTTIVMAQVAQRFFRGQNLLLAIAAIVVSANAGGAFSPIGDVTTLMLWLAGKFSALEVISQLFFPSLFLFLVSNWLLARRLQADTQDVEEETQVSFSLSEKIICGFVFLAFTMPFFFSQLGLPPYLGIITGLAFVWFVGDVVKIVVPQPSHLSVDINRFLQKTDIATLKFFIGILLAVSALAHLGILAHASEAMFGNAPTEGRLIAGSVVLGILSAVVDNVPLTAAAIDILHTTNSAIWSLLALAVGTGGSLLIIGSAAGIVAMGTAQEMTFFRYLRIATVPAFIGYVAAIVTWFIQFRLFFA